MLIHRGNERRVLAESAQSHQSAAKLHIFFELHKYF